MTGIRERRWWDPDFALHAARPAPPARPWRPPGFARERIGMLIYAGVCRENFEPATACAVADALGIRPERQVYDLSNACLGVLNGMVDVANRIELGQIRAGLVVACESRARSTRSTIERLLREKSMDVLRKTLATLTGGSGAVAVLLTDGSLAPAGHRLLGGVAAARPSTTASAAGARDTGIPGGTRPHGGRPTRPRCCKTASRWAIETFRRASARPRLGPQKLDKVICHQVGATHRDTILDALGHPAGEGLHHLPVPRQHRHRLAADDGRHRRGARLPRPGDRSASSASAAG